MQHTIKPDSYGALTGPMAEAVTKCVHCGFCLPACPTYQELGSESESPRGRIVIMKEVLEGTLTVAVWAVSPASPPALRACPTAI